MTTKFITALVIAAMSATGWVHSIAQAQVRFPLTEHQVAQALTSNGIETADRQVTLLAKVVAAEFGITPTYVYSLTSGKNRAAK